MPFQFTPLREGRLVAPFSSTLGKYFNSRPSARGDARDPCYITITRTISIHAPPRGATSRHDTLHRVRVHFNSRPSARGDAGRTHGFCYRQHFNSRPSARGDAAWRVWMNYYPTFQFTPLREGRRFRISAKGGRKYFNSRPSARGDAAQARQRQLIICLFQFTPLREGRPFTPTRCATLSRISIHAPPRGATRDEFAKLGGWDHFNSRPSARGDHRARRER